MTEETRTDQHPLLVASSRTAAAPLLPAPSPDPPAAPPAHSLATADAAAPPVPTCATAATTAASAPSFQPAPDDASAKVIPLSPCGRRRRRHRLRLAPPIPYPFTPGDDDGGRAA
jgi:hypothetical protein